MRNYPKRQCMDCSKEIDPRAWRCYTCRGKCRTLPIRKCKDCGIQVNRGSERCFKCSSAFKVVPLATRFHKYVEKSNSCWKWKGGVSAGYGMFGSRGAHRIAWTIYRGEIPSGIFVCHRCDNPLCVNPDHLFLGTHSENMKDMKAKGRSNYISGEQSPKSKLTEKDVKNIRKSYKRNIVTMRSLADRYGVSMGAIQSVLNRTNWKHI